jgi:hypothetical protein
MTQSGKLIGVTEVNGIGTRRMSFRTQMTKDQFFDAMNEQGRVFKLEMRSWDAETGEAEITLVPGNGLMAWYEGHNPPIETETMAAFDHDKIQYREPTENDVKNGPIKCDYREWPWLKWKTGTLVRLMNRSGRSPYVIIKDGDEIAYQHCRIKVTSPESPTLPPEGPQFG